MTRIRRRIGLGAHRTPAAAAAALMLLLTGPAAHAESKPADRPFSLFSPQEASVRFSYGIGDRDSLRFYTFGPRVAYDLLPSIIPPLFDNRIRLAIELMGAFIHGDHHDLDGEFDFTPLLFDYRYDRGGAFVPFFEGGEGITLTTLDNEHIGGPFEFSSQFGGGLHLFFTSEQALTLAVRYRHISNAGIKEPNRGLNTFFVTVGLGNFPDRP